MHVKEYALARNVPASTVFKAVAAGLIIPLLEGGIDPAQADRDWFDKYAARAQRVTAGNAARERTLHAGIVATTTEIGRLRRQLLELRRSTAPAETAAAAVERRAARLLAALDALPGLAAPAAAEALQRPPEAVRAALSRFVALLAADLGDVPAQASRLVDRQHDPG